MIVSRDSKLILYGYNDICKKLVNKLLDEQYNLVAIVDRSFLQEYDEHKHIYKVSIENIGIVGNLGECIVIICLNDGIKHKAIADELYNYGARYILYLPMSIYDGELSRQTYIRATYNSFIHGIFESVDVMEYKRVNNQYIVIRKDKDYTSFWCPIDYLYTSTIDMFHNIDPKKKEVKKYFGCKVEELVPYLELYRHIDNKVEMSLEEEYFLIQRDDIADRQLLYENKKELYNLFEDYLRFDINMFSDSPAYGRLNREKGIINISDGHHRLLFLIYKGYKQVPVCISNDDYDSFLKIIGENEIYDKER